VPSEGNCSGLPVQLWLEVGEEINRNINKENGQYKNTPLFDRMYQYFIKYSVTELGRTVQFF
jgi:hypothetical protein